MIWSEEAEKAVGRVPFFVRKRVRQLVEKEAAQSGSSQVLMKHVQACRERFMSGKGIDIKGHQIETCFGAGGCENRAVESTGLIEELERLFSERNVGGFLGRTVQGGLKMHHVFRVSVADCPNACSRPQIVDIGIIGACRPGISEESCTGCGGCTAVCREGAIQLQGQEAESDCSVLSGKDGKEIACSASEPPLFDYDKCVQCGKCSTVCSSGAIEQQKKGYRILLGGKLGRHPQLGRELDGIFTEREVLAIVDCCLDVYFANSTAGERFGAVLNRIGYDAIIGAGREVTA